MRRTLNRPMFRRGGEVDRHNYDVGGPTFKDAIPTA